MDKATLDYIIQSSNDIAINGLSSLDKKAARLEEAKQVKLQNFQPAILRSVLDGDTIHLNNDPTATRIQGIDTYETPHSGDWLLNPYNQKRMDKQRAQLSSELGRPVTNEEVFQRGLQDKSASEKLLTPIDTKYNVPSLVLADQELNPNPMDKSPRNNYGRNLATVKPLAGEYTDVRTGKTINPTGRLLGVQEQATPTRSSSQLGHYKNLSRTPIDTSPVVENSYESNRDPNSITNNLLSPISGAVAMGSRLYEGAQKDIGETFYSGVSKAGDFLQKVASYTGNVPIEDNVLQKLGKYGMSTVKKAQKEQAEWRDQGYFDKTIGFDNSAVNAMGEQFKNNIKDGKVLTAVKDVLTNPAAITAFGQTLPDMLYITTGVGIIHEMQANTATSLNKLQENADKAGVQLTEADRAISVGLSVVQTYLDRIGAGAVLNKGAVKTMKDALATTLMKMEAPIRNEVVKTLAKDLQVVGINTAKLLGSTAVEGATEGVQQILQGKAEDKSLMNLSLTDKEIDKALVATGIGLGAGGVGTTSTSLGDIKDIAKAGYDIPATLVSEGINKVRTAEPTLTSREKRDVQMAGGTTAPSTTSATNYADTEKKFYQQLRSGTKEEAYQTLDSMMTDVANKIDSGELSDTSPELIDAKATLTKMHREYRKSLSTDTKPEVDFARAEYSRYANDPNTDPEVLGAKKESLAKALSDKIDYGVMLDDVSMSELDSMAEFYGLDKKKVEQYKSEQSALKELAKLEAGTKAKDIKSVIYESMLGEKGVHRLYADMKAAEMAKDRDTYIQSLRQMKHFKMTQEHKLKMLQQGIEQYKNEVKKDKNAVVEVAYSVDDRVKPFSIGVSKSIESPTHAVNAVNKLMREIDTTVGLLDALIPKKKAESKKETPKAKPVQQKEEKPVQETVQQEETAPATEKAKIKEKDRSVYTKDAISKRVEKTRTTLDKMKIKAQSIYKGARKQDIAIEAIGEVKGKEVVLNEEAVQALTKAELVWLYNDASRLMDVQDKDLERLLGVDSLTIEQRTALAGKGLLRKNIVQALGQVAMQDLGVVMEKDRPYNEYYNIQTALGNVLLAKLIKDGVLETVSIPKDQWNRISERKTDKDVPMVRLGKNATAAMKDARSFLKNEGSELLDEDGKIKGPSYGKKPKGKVEYRKRSGNLSEYDKESIQAQREVQHNVKMDVYEALQKLSPNDRLRAAGYVFIDEDTPMHSTERESIIAQNQAIQRAMEQMEEHVAEADGREYYFNYFVSGNGRHMIDSNTFNPQSNKIHRHLDYTGKPYNPIESERGEYLFKIAVLQGLGMKVENMLPTDVESNWNKLSSDESVVAYAEALTKGSIDKALSKEISEYAGKKAKMHTIDALVALGQYIDSQRTGKPMQTTLQLEVDAVTSGWILALLQNPAFDMQTVKEYLAKGGVFVDNMDVTLQQAKAEGQRDSYETIADAVGPIINSMKVSENVKAIMPADRSFAKAPFMTNIVYGAGIAGVKADIANTFIQNMYNKMVKSEEDLALVKQVLKEITGKDVSIKNPAEYMLDEATRKVVVQYINDTYGKAVEKAMGEKYKAFTKTRDAINKVFQEMYKRYEGEYAKAYAELQKKGDITKADLDQMEKDLVKYIPTIKSPTGSDVQIFSKEKMHEINADLLKVQTQFLDGDTSGITTTAERSRIAASKAAGGVVPIHFIDSAVIARILREYQVQGIYDAAMIPLYDVDAVTTGYNKALIDVSKEYSLLNEIIKSAKEAGVDTSALEQYAKVANENREKLFSSDLNVQHFSMDGIAYKTDGSTNVPVKSTSKDYQAIMSVIERFEKEC